MIQVYLEGGKTIKKLLVAPKDKDSIIQKNAAIYRFTYDRLECDEEYDGESSKTFPKRLKEHLNIHTLYKSGYSICNLGITSAKHNVISGNNICHYISTPNLLSSTFSSDLKPC